MLRMHTDRSSRLPRTLIGLAAVVALFVLAGPVFAAEAAESSEAAAAATAGDGKSWGAFFGRLHVVVLHLPIGLLVGAFVIELLGIFRRSKGYDVAAAWLFVLGFFASVFAVVSGLLLGSEVTATADRTLSAVEILYVDEGVSETLQLHMWLGIGLTILAGVAAFLKIIAVNKQWPDDVAVPDHGGLPLGITRLALIGIIVLMPLVGHLGGNMVHGRDYLTERTPSDTVNKVIEMMHLTGASSTKIKDDGTPVELGTVKYWNVKIQPALNDHCVACHGADSQKGKLRLDTLEWAMKGGSVGGTIEPGDAEFSEMYRRVILPPSHDDFMPTNVKKHGMMSQKQIHELGEWITQYDGRLKDPEEPKKPENGTTPDGTDNGGDNGTTASRPLIDPAAIRAIEDAGGSAQSLSQEENPELLTVKFAYLKTLDPEAVAKIGNTANQVAWLTFEGSAFNDTAVNQMPALPKLVKLNLKDTQVTDAGLEALPELPSLEWLNLFGTDITDAGLDSLKRYTSLDKLYLTGTNVTEAGVAKLRAALPDTKVYSDFDGQFSFAEPEPEPVAGKPINTVCPVSGQPVKEGFVSVFEGKTVGFCCNNCKGKFDANPAAFKDKIKPAPGNAETPEPPKPADPADQQSAKPVNDKCVVSGAPIDAKQFVIYKNKKVAFCCGNCKAKFEKNPEQFAAKIP